MANIRARLQVWIELDGEGHWEAAEEKPVRTGGNPRFLSETVGILTAEIAERLTALVESRFGKTPRVGGDS